MEPIRHFSYHDPNAIVSVLLKSALETTAAADDPVYRRLPPPVRYRATGAIDAWKRVMVEGAKVGHADFGSAIPVFPVERLYDEFPRFVKGWGGSLISGISEHDALLAHRSLLWQIYYGGDGVMYEPTAALHRLLDDAYIAEDVPVGLIELPAPAMCIVPSPEWTGVKQKGIRAIAVFRRDFDTPSVRGQHLTIATWQETEEGATRLRFGSYPLSDPDKTIVQVIDDIPEGSAEDREYVLFVLGYVAKLLLYLKLPDARIEANLAHSRASRDLRGLGERKRRERLAQIEQLYDRHVVGPAVLDWERPGGDLSEAGASHHEKRAHWRRPHFKMQPYGPSSSLRKVICVGPVIVRADRLSQ
ncbi:hypothetical protein WR30_18420 [Burkholderia contaminans FFH2055]|uniref:hypothetical protein n=1 Tax=Burkholderia contaminans TaxID=488447 RepID=UPI00062655D7|nr:hypothetical protein [Burkholderia contaminans]KKL35662.1 hypothetical protein WR30_18420 [Burkholderia contaminans FFH2055]MEB4636820.1 hypothetical protein [Burkholderia contaminans]MEB4651637.1 hypothetical protein [Burkholderia contaminans]MEB4661208.1 hypothetical protein [Burkholderia contaminans]MEB4667182.1 hypothetical protein [Burkholderia contaminans]